MRTQTREEQVIQLIAASGMLLCLFMLSLRVPGKKEMTLKAFASSSRSLPNSLHPTQIQIRIRIRIRNPTSTPIGAFNTTPLLNV